MTEELLSEAKLDEVDALFDVDPDFLEVDDKVKGEDYNGGYNMLSQAYAAASPAINPIGEAQWALTYAGVVIRRSPSGDVVVSRGGDGTPLKAFEGHQCTTRRVCEFLAAALLGGEKGTYRLNGDGKVEKVSFSVRVEPEIISSYTVCAEDGEVLGTYMDRHSVCALRQHLVAIGSPMAIIDFVTTSEDGSGSYDKYKREDTGYMYTVKRRELKGPEALKFLREQAVKK